MSEAYDVIVAGGGVAGLTAAAYIARSGRKVLLCERSRSTGGLVNSFNVQGYTFDAGLRAFENSGILFPMLRDLGIEVEFSPNELSIAVGDQSIVLKDRASLEDYRLMLLKLFPANDADIASITAEISKVMDYMGVIYGIDNPLFIDYQNDREYLMKTLLPWLMKYQINMKKTKRLNKPIREYLRNFTKNDALIDIIIQHFFAGTPTFFALSYFSLYLDYVYAKGGTATLPRALTTFIQDKGGVILTEAEAAAIDPEGHRLELADGRAFTYKKLIWAADQTRLYETIQATIPKKAKTYRDLIAKSEGGDSVLSLYIGATLDCDYFAGISTAHIFFTPHLAGLSSLASVTEAINFDRAARLRWIEQYLERTTFEISLPALRDPALAPEGKCGLIVSTLMDYRLVAKLAEDGEYEAFKLLCSEKIIEILDQSIYPGLRDHVEFNLCSTPLTIERESGNRHGAITGWAFTNDKMPSVHDLTKIKRSVQTHLTDIFQCGQWTFSPSGMPVSVLGGKLAADAVIKELQERKK